MADRPAPAEVVAAAVAEAASRGGGVSIDEFVRIKLIVGLIQHAERVPKSNKLVRMDVDLGEGSSGRSSPASAPPTRPSSSSAAAPSSSPTSSPPPDGRWSPRA